MTVRLPGLWQGCGTAGSRLGIRVISGTGGSEEAVNDLAHFGGQVRQAGFLAGARISEAGDRIGQIGGGLGVVPAGSSAARLAQQSGQSPGF